MNGKKNIEDTDSYELDLDETSSLAVDDVMEDAARAVEAVEDRHRGGAASSGAGNGAAAAPAETKENEDLAAMRERYLRVLADFDNFRKRTERERDNLRRAAAADVLRDMLETADNLERAITAGGSVEELKNGLQMVLRQQEDLFRRHGATRIEAVGKTFDPAIHEAVMREESTEVSSPTVVAEFQRGYLLYDRLLRPALVRVAVPAARPAEDPEAR
jgi:molecular chaperone GrpE